MRRGMRSRASTDTVVPRARGAFPSACLVSVDENKALLELPLADGHAGGTWSYPTVACAADLALAVARELAPPQ